MKCRYANKMLDIVWTVSKNDLAWPLQSESDPSEKKLFEHQKQKFRKLNEQLIDEKEKYSAAQREYYQLIQKSDKVKPNPIFKTAQIYDI